jgi:hypothetical protein
MGGDSISPSIWLIYCSGDMNFEQCCDKVHEIKAIHPNPVKLHAAESISERFFERVKKAGLRGLAFNKVWSGSA